MARQPLPPRCHVGRVRRQLWPLYGKLHDSFYPLFNASHESVVFTLPPSEWSEGWVLALDTNQGVPGEEKGEIYEPEQQLDVPAGSLIVLCYAS